MVNFKVKLENERIEKWKHHYIDYKGLQSHLRLPVVSSPSARLPSLSFGSKPLLRDDFGDFENAFLEELQKVEKFYNEKLEELRQGYQIQVQQTEAAEEIADIDIEDEKEAASSELRKAESLKRSLHSYYRQVKYLQSFCILNYTGFVKIIKKKRKVDKESQGGVHLSINMDQKLEKDSDSISRRFQEVEFKDDESANSPNYPGLDAEEKKNREMEQKSVGSLEATIINKKGVSVELEDEETLESVTQYGLRAALDKQNFATSVKARGEVTVLVKRTEKLFAKKFCSGDMVQALAELLSKQNVASFDWRPFHLGYRSGACLILTFWLLWDSIVDTIYRPPKDSSWIHSMLPVYRLYFCLVLMIWLAGCMVFVWKKHRINYIYIFELDPRKVPTLEEIYMQATNATILVMTNFILYYKVLRGDFPSWIPSPYITMLLVLISMVWAMSHWRSSKRVFFVCWEVISLLWLGGEVNFLTAFVADVFTSMAKLWVDLAYTVCVITTGAWIHHSAELTQTQCAKNYYFTKVAKVIVTVLPLYFRFLQNIKLYRKFGRPFPFLPNAMKYVVSIAVGLFSSLHAAIQVGEDSAPYTAFYILFTCIATIYSYVWDVLMDWGLGRSSHGGLRERLMFGRRWVYWIVIFVDLFGRFMWVITLLPANDNPIPLFPELLAPFLAAIELCRRAMWGCFRLENEHLNNTGFRRFDGPVPDHFDTAMGPKRPREKKDLLQITKELSVMIGLGGLLIGISIYFGLKK